jgi:hypothetical protein
MFIALFSADSRVPDRRALAIVIAIVMPTAQGVDFPGGRSVLAAATEQFVPSDELLSIPYYRTYNFSKGKPRGKWRGEGTIG